jgi:hypothetical protein
MVYRLQSPNCMLPELGRYYNVNPNSVCFCSAVYFYSADSGWYTVCSDDSYYLPQSLQEKSEIVPQFEKERVLPGAFQFLIIAHPRL